MDGARRIACALGAPILIIAACKGGPSTGAPGPDADAGPSPQTLQLAVTAVDTTFVTRDHFIASVEMQISGEPFAEAMGRDLGGYSRDFVCQLSACEPSVYYDPALNDGVAGGPNGRIDLAGYASAVESYEYSKQPMNNLAFESGAGTSLAFGPVLNPAGATGADALSNLRAWVQHAAVQADTTARTVTTDVTPANPLGWPGFWPTLQPFTQWDPSIHASSASTGCTISSDDDPGASGALECDDYECDSTSLHLPDRASQVNLTIGPGASGWAGWKEALWTLNYLQVMHDTGETGVNTVPADQLALVGTGGNAVVGDGGAGVATVPGTFLGSSDIEGFQAANFLQILDNQAQQWLTELTTTDGATLGGFASIMDALAYSDQSPPRWFPGSIAVTETQDDSGFPRPVSYSIASPDSDLLDLAGLLGSFSSIYSLTDQSNAQVGGSPAGARVLRRRSLSRPEPDADRRADAARPGARDDARAHRQHGAPPRRSGVRHVRRRRAPRRRERLARDDALDRHGRLRAPLAADGPPRARLAARALQQHAARRARGPVSARRTPGVSGDDVRRAARRAHCVARERLLCPADYGGRSRLRRAGTSRRARPRTTAPASTRTRRRSAAFWSRTSRRGIRSTETVLPPSSSGSRAPSTIPARASIGRRRATRLPP